MSTEQDERKQRRILAYQHLQDTIRELRLPREEQAARIREAVIEYSSANERESWHAGYEAGKKAAFEDISTAMSAFFKQAIDLEPTP